MTKRIEPVVFCLHLAAFGCEQCKGIVKHEIEKERERCVRAIREYGRHFPRKLFKEPPPYKHGKTVDGCSARAIRCAVRNLIEMIREGK